MATDYSKWDYFTDTESSDSEEKDPIVPENDPAFQAMKWDMEKRFHKRKVARKEANILKDRGNKYFKIGKYNDALTYYT